MRRLASVFAAASRRTDKSDVPSSADDVSPSRLAHKKSRVFSLSRKHISSVGPPSLPPIVAGDLANSSSSTSSGSTTLRTPDDDGLPRTPSKKGSWKSWLGRRNTATSDHTEGLHSHPWQSSKDALRPPKSASNETDDASTQSDDPYSNTDDIHSSPHSPQEMADARANARVVIMNSLVHEPTAAPLFQTSDSVSFPRSCHNPRRLRRRETLESELHKKSLLARLECLSPAAELSIAPFASMPIHSNPQTQLNLRDDVFPLAGSVSLSSSGLESWVSRPCIEDRLQMWTRSDSGEIIRTRIPGSHLGVAALEFSESLELLAGTLQESYVDTEEVAGAEAGEEATAAAGTVFDPALEFTLPPLDLSGYTLPRATIDAQIPPVDPDPPATQKKLVLEPPPSQPEPPQSKASPVEQLIETPVALPEVTSPVPLPNGTTSGSTVTSGPVPKRGVRFADDDGKDDQIPLGYVLRIRKNKEQKARFLREERERRARAARLPIENRRVTAATQEHRITTPRRHPVRPLVTLNQLSQPQQPEPVTVSHVLREEELLRREAERVEMEKLRRSRESSRKQAEERERNYTEELRATRARREASRAGRPLESATLSTRVPDRDRPASRDSVHASLRGSSMSHKHTPELVFSPISPYDGSPASSVPATPGSQYSFSRPPSLYSAHTTSSEDVRAREGKRASRRMSVVSEPSKGMTLHPPHDPRVSFNPYAWPNVPPVHIIPPVPPIPVIPTVNGVPFYGVDIPLLPPTAPFMMNQFGVRSRSSIGLAGQQSPLQSSTSLPRNHSSEGVHSSSRNSSPRSSGSHYRRSSDDATRTTKIRGDARPGSYTDVRGSKTSGSMGVALPQGSPQRSSWFPPEQGSAKKSSSLRPASSVYPSGSHVHMRRRTAAS